MVMHRVCNGGTRCVIVCSFVLALLVPPSLFSQVNQNCIVSVLNRNIQPTAEGVWILPNVPANFGPVRARANCVVNGQTVSGESVVFSVPSNGSVTIPPRQLGSTTPIPTLLTLN